MDLTQCGTTNASDDDATMREADLYEFVSLRLSLVCVRVYFWWRSGVVGGDIKLTHTARMFPCHLCVCMCVCVCIVPVLRHLNGILFRPPTPDGVIRPLFAQDQFFGTFSSFLKMCEQQDDGSGHLRDVVQWARGLLTTKSMPV